MKSVEITECVGYKAKWINDKGLERFLEINTDEGGRLDISSFHYDFTLEKDELEIMYQLLGQIISRVKKDA